ncbi:MAG: anaerobic ribonucleoside-triphosphate reductase activating protein [Muribaculaceae bacterium]|nr:anaerobic ribonucleoside-triphosphate reductase activating protein [Muribaculaceae bacterium]
MIDVYKIIKNTQVEGPGTRFCIWVQGCKKHCLGCFAKETWEFGVGQKYSVEDLFSQIKTEKGIEGVTFLGGEPFEQAEELALLSEKIKTLGLSIVCFTGYTINELKAKNNTAVNKLLNYIDLLIDGGFEEDKFDLSRPWVGSSNQKYIYLTDLYKPQDIKVYKNRIEARIQPDGRVEFNGMGDFHNLNKKFCLQLGKNIVK